MILSMHSKDALAVFHNTLVANGEKQDVYIKHSQSIYGLLFDIMNAYPCGKSWNNMSIVMFSTLVLM